MLMPAAGSSSLLVPIGQKRCDRVARVAKDYHHQAPPLPRQPLLLPRTPMLSSPIMRAMEEAVAWRTPLQHMRCVKNERRRRPAGGAAAAALCLHARHAEEVLDAWGCCAGLRKPERGSQRILLLHFADRPAEQR